MKRISKIMALVLAVLMTALLFAGCAGDTDTATDTATTTVVSATTASTDTATDTDTTATTEPHNPLLGDEYTYDFVTLSLPVGFTTQENGAGYTLATPGGDASSADKIEFSQWEKEDIGIYTREYIEESFGENLIAYDMLKLGDLDVISISCKANANGVDTVQTIVGIFGADHSNRILYTRVSEDLEASFAASVATLRAAG